MALSDAYQASSEALLTDMAQRPQPRRPQAPAFSIWSTITAAPKGTAAGAAQGVASTSDVLGAFGSVLGAVGDAGSQGMFGGLTDEERKQSNTAREKLITAGPDYNSEAGRSFRNVAKDYMPDPATAHGAEQAVANLFRVGAKAVTAAVTLGNVPGAIVAGAEEGFTQSDELGQQGVDLATRTKVGAVTALTNAAGFALPVAGQTWKGTVGLALAGGPASYVAQNAATREILKNANYEQLANQYDPFDPVGLALSTLLPLGFGALAMRGAARGAKVDAETVDAARVTLLREQVDSARVTPPEDFAGAAAHTQAMARAMDQIADGGRVEVSDVAPQMNAAGLIVENGAPVVFYHGTDQAFDQFDLRYAQAEGIHLTSDAAIANRYAQSRAMDNGRGANVRPVFVEAERIKDVDFISTATIQEAAAEGFEAVRRGGHLVVMDPARVRSVFDSPAARITDEMAARLGAVTRAFDEVAPAEKPPTKAAMEAQIVEAQTQAKADAEPAAKAPPPKEGAEFPELGRAAMDLEARAPDLQVQLDGMDAPMKVSELMARVREEAKAYASEAPLVEAAAQCFLRTLAG